MARAKPLAWPGGARVAVLAQLGFEGWLHDHPETRIIPKVPEEEVKAGRPDYVGRAWAAYGSDTGGWRVLKLLDKYGIQGTSLFSAIAAETNPEFCRQWVKSGHEIAGHSYAQDLRVFRMSPDEERANIRRCVEIFERIGGYRPVGWNSPGGQCSESTTRILLEEGFFYSYDYKDDDQPHTAEVIDGKAMIAVPKLFDANDVTSYSVAFHSPSEYVESFCRSFDVLYEEGATDAKMLSLSVHAPVFGRPFGITAMEECIRYVKSFPDVWFATGRQVAEWWQQHGDPQPSYPEGLTRGKR